MKPFRLLTTSLAALAVFASAEAAAQHRAVSGGLRLPVPSHNHFSWERGHGFNHRFRGGFGGGVWIIERPVIVEREVVREAPPPPAAVPLPEQARGGTRKPYVIGASSQKCSAVPRTACALSSLPGGCMKMIEDGEQYYYCSGEWYKQSGGRYLAVTRKL